MSSLTSIPIVVLAALLSLATLAAAVALELTGHDPTQAWTGFGLALGATIGLPVDPTRRLGAPRPGRETDPAPPAPPAAG